MSGRRDLRILLVEDEAIIAIMLEDMLADFKERAEHLAAAQKLVADEMAAEVVAELREQLAAPDPRLYWSPGDRAPTTGNYRSFHLPQCPRPPFQLFRPRASEFPPCPYCEEQVMYRLSKLPLIGAP